MACQVRSDRVSVSKWAEVSNGEIVTFAFLLSLSPIICFPISRLSSHGCRVVCQLLPKWAPTALRSFIRYVIRWPAFQRQKEDRCLSFPLLSYTYSVSSITFLPAAPCRPIVFQWVTRESVSPDAQAPHDPLTFIAPSFSFNNKKKRVCWIREFNCCRLPLNRSLEIDLHWLMLATAFYCWYWNAMPNTVRWLTSGDRFRL